MTAGADAALAAALDGRAGRALLDYAVALDREITRLEAARADALAAINHSEAYKLEGCVTTASWWRHATRRTPADASREVTTARRLRWLPETSAAWRNGQISARHAERIARADVPNRHDVIAAAEGALVEVARHSDATDVGRACRLLAEQAESLPDPDDGPQDPDVPAGGDRASGDTPAAPNGLDARGELFLSETFEGLWAINGTLDAVLGARLAAQLDARSRPDPPDTPERRRRTPAQRRHAAFDELVKAAEERGDAPTVHGKKPHVLVLVDLRWLLGHEGGHPPRLGGTDAPLGRDRALELLFAGTLTPVATWGGWRPVAVGDTHRTLPGWLRPLLEAFHGSCRGPDCDRPIAWVDAAHLDPWRTYRDTQFDRTLPLCRAQRVGTVRVGVRRCPAVGAPDQVELVPRPRPVVLVTAPSSSVPARHMRRLAGSRPIIGLGTRWHGGVSIPLRDDQESVRPSSR